VRFSCAVTETHLNFIHPDQYYADVKVSKKRRVRLTENDFILATNFTLQNNQNRFTDNTFYLFKTKIESAGSIILISNTTKQTVNRNGKYEL
jgi:hypothetical protein